MIKSRQISTAQSKHKASSAHILLFYHLQMRFVPAGWKCSILAFILFCSIYFNMTHIIYLQSNCTDLCLSANLMTEIVLVVAYTEITIVSTEIFNSETFSFIASHWP